LTNTNRNTDIIFSLVYCSDIYQLNFPSLNLLVDTNMNILMVYTKGIIVGKEGIKKKLNNMMTCKFYKRHYQWNWPDNKIHSWICRRKTFISIYWWHYER
jgi:hypothetical protein